MTQTIELAYKDVKTVIINITPFHEKTRGKIRHVSINMENTEYTQIKHLQMKNNDI